MAGMTTLLSFNRDQEREADLAALRALHAEYGHVGGASDLFNVMLQLPGAGPVSSAPTVEFLRTHPLTENRVAAIRQWALENGAAMDGKRRPLPPGIEALRKTVRNEGEKSGLPRPVEHGR